MVVPIVYGAVLVGSAALTALASFNLASILKPTKSRITISAIGSGQVRMWTIEDTMPKKSVTGKNVSVLVDVNTPVTVVAIPDPVVGIYDKWVDTVTKSYLYPVTTSGSYTFTASKDSYVFTCHFLDTTKIEAMQHGVVLPPIITGTIPLVNIGDIVPEDTNFDGTFMVGTCKCEPYTAFLRSWYRVKDNTGQEIYSGLSSSAVARYRAEGDSRCIKPYVDPTLSLLPVDQGKEKEKPKEDEGYGEIIIVAGIGLLAIAVIYLYRRKT